MKTIEAFDPERIADNKFVVVFSSKRFCSACKVLECTIDKMDTIKGIYIYEIDVDKYPDVATRYSVMALPTLLFFNNGKVMSMLAGAIPEMHLHDAIKGL